MKSLRVMLISFLMVFGLNLSAADELVLDKGHSQVGFSIKHLMISNVKGVFTDYDADLIFDQKSKKFEKFDATIQAKSIDTGIQKRDDHLRSSDFFEVEKYPELKFVMDSYTVTEDGGIMTGKMSMHGITQPVKLEVEFNGSVKDLQGNTRLGFTIEGKINRKDFGLTWNKALEAGGVVVGDTVKIHVELETLVL